VQSNSCRENPSSGRASAMDLHLFDLNLLVALDALLTERNVTRAG
jgi:hypothetical protein